MKIICAGFEPSTRRILAGLVRSWVGRVGLLWLPLPALLWLILAAAVVQCFNFSRLRRWDPNEKSSGTSALGITPQIWNSELFLHVLPTMGSCYHSGELSRNHHGERSVIMRNLGICQDARYQSKSPLEPCEGGETQELVALTSCRASGPATPA